MRPRCPRFRLAPSQRSSPQPISHGSQRSSQAISHSFPCVHDVHASVSLPPSGALPNLFPTVPNGAPKLFPTVSHPSTMSMLPSRSLPTELSPSYFPRFPIRRPRSPSIRPRCPYFHLAPSQRSSAQAISHGFLPKLFPRLPVRPACPHFHFASSHRTSQAISHGFPSVHPVVASVSLPPRGKINETRTQASEMLLGKTFTQRNFTHRAFTQTSFYTQRLLHQEAFTHTCSETSYRIIDVECITRAKTLQFNLTGEI